MPARRVPDLARPARSRIGGGAAAAPRRGTAPPGARPTVAPAERLGKARAALRSVLPSDRRRRLWRQHARRDVRGGCRRRDGRLEPRVMCAPGGRTLASTPAARPGRCGVRSTGDKQGLRHRCSGRGRRTIRRSPSWSRTGRGGSRVHVRSAGRRRGRARRRVPPGPPEAAAAGPRPCPRTTVAPARRNPGSRLLAVGEPPVEGRIPWKAVNALPAVSGVLAKVASPSSERLPVGPVGPGGRTVRLRHRSPEGVTRSMWASAAPVSPQPDRGDALS